MAPEIFRRAGYATVAVTGGGFLDARFGFTRGFDVYRQWRVADRHRDELATHVQWALDALEQRVDRPFFLLFHTYEVHSPYRARAPAFERSEGGRQGLAVEIARRGESDSLDRHFLLRPGADEEPRPILPEMAGLPGKLYASGVAFTDQLIGRLLERLGEPDLASRTVVVVTSDHGEALGEDGLVGHGFLHETNLLVPLIIATPDGLGAGTTLPDQVRGVDLLPTLLELASLAVPPGLNGVSLVAALRGERGTVPDTAWSASRHFGLATRQAGGPVSVVPNSDWTDGLPAGLAQVPSNEEDPALRRQLRALGYVD